MERRHFLFKLLGYIKVAILLEFGKIRENEKRRRKLWVNKVFYYIVKYEISIIAYFKISSCRLLFGRDNN
jgi:hypothetical protein